MGIPGSHRMLRIVSILLLNILLLPSLCFSHSTADLRQLAVPRQLELSEDGSLLWYKLGDDWWRIDTTTHSQPSRDNEHRNKPPQVPSGSHGSSAQISPDGKQIAYLDRERPYGPQLLFCVQANKPDSSAGKPVSQKPIFAFQWMSNSQGLWVIAAEGADEPIGRLSLDGHFEQLTQDPALRMFSGIAAANDVLAWVQSDGSHHGTIWIRDRAGNSRIVFDPSPQTSEWSRQWTQQVVRWKNAHGEELQGVLVLPRCKGPLPLVVDPYSNRRNRFLNIPTLGNYEFVKAGYAVFFPNHRAPHAFPEVAFGTSYVGASRDRDPVDTLTDDVMSGVNELVRRGIADPRQLFLYSSSNGASAINQLLTQTNKFRAAVSHGGVADWLGHYRMRHPLGDETIPGFLGGRRPDDSMELYRRISPVYHAARISTPLLLIVGRNDTGIYADTIEFYHALRKHGKPVRLIVYRNEGHEILSASLSDAHIRTAIRFFNGKRGNKVRPRIAVTAGRLDAGRPRQL